MAFSYVAGQYLGPLMTKLQESTPRVYSLAHSLFGYKGKEWCFFSLQQSLVIYTTKNIFRATIFLYSRCPNSLP